MQETHQIHTSTGLADALPGVDGGSATLPTSSNRIGTLLAHSGRILRGEVIARPVGQPMRRVSLAHLFTSQMTLCARGLTAELPVPPIIVPPVIVLALRKAG
jgi:hypothetical protein